MNAIKNFIYNSSYQILLFAVPLITTPYVSRVLLPGTIGRYSYSFTVASYFVMLVMMGLENYGNRSVAEVKDDKKILSNIFWSIFSLQLIVGLIVTIAYLCYCYFFAKDKSVALIFAINVFAAVLNISWFVYGMEQFRVIAIITTVVKVISTAAIFLFVKSNNDLIVYCLIMVLSTLISNLLMWIVVVKNINFVVPKVENIFVHFKPNVLLFLTVISTTICKTVDKIMLGIVEPEKIQLGYYEMSERIINIPVVLVAALGTVMLPRITNMISNNDDSYKKSILYSMIFSIFIASSMSFGIMGVAKEFVPLFYGPGYDVCIGIYLVLLPASIFMAFSNVIRTQYMLPNHMDNKVVVSGYLGVVVNVCANLLLIPKYGAIGAAIGTVVAETVSCLYQSYSVRGKLPLRKYVLYSSPFVFVGILMFVGLYLIDIPIKSIALSLTLKIIFGLIVYAVLILTYYILLGRFNSIESNEMHALVKTFFKRRSK